MHCRPIATAADLRAFYWLLEEACQRLSARENRDHFAPDVYAALLRGEATAVVVQDGALPLGLYVVCQDDDPDGRPALYVWIGYVRPGGAPEVVETGLAGCEAMAREQGFGSLVFGTQRRGWLRHAQRLGFELVEYRYVKQVQA